MKSLEDLYIFAEELLEYALDEGDEDTALIIEEAFDFAQVQEEPDWQLAELLMALVSIEDRISVPAYPIESVITLRMTLRGMNASNSNHYAH